MPRIIVPPKEKYVQCDQCGATIGYQVFEIEIYHGRDISGGPDGYERVKCPDFRCSGHGYISRW